MAQFTFYKRKSLWSERKAFGIGEGGERNPGRISTHICVFYLKAYISILFFFFGKF